MEGVREPRPRALVWATDIDVLGLDHVVGPRDGYLVVRSPANPFFWWGNLLLFDEPPAPGDGARWEERFAAEFADEPRVRHRTFAWDRTDGAVGEAATEFLARGYLIERTVGLIASSDEIAPHPRENRDVAVRPLSSEPGADAAAWEAVLELQLASRDPELDPVGDREFLRARMAQHRAIMRAGGGAWYVACAPGGEIVGSLGVIVAGQRGRYQAVDTAEAYRGRGICSRLVVEAARHAAAVYGARRFVIAADPDYHALGLYESLGFRPAERVAGVMQRPPGNAPETGG